MDLLFSKYANPFLFVDTMLSNGTFSEFVGTVWELEAEKKNWEFFLHKVYGVSYGDFLKSLETANSSEPIEPIETTVKNSAKILREFIPDKKKG